ACQHRGTRDIPPRRQDVGKVEDRGGESACHESELHGRGEPAGLSRTQVQGGRERRTSGTRGQPHRHPQQHDGGEQRELPPPSARFTHPLSLPGTPTSVIARRSSTSSSSRPSRTFLSVTSCLTVLPVASASFARRADSAYPIFGISAVTSA